MKKNSLILAIVLILIVNFSMAVASQRYEVFEIGESGSLIFFEKNDEQIPLKDEVTKSEKMLSPKQNPTDKYELAESGAYIEFPASAKQYHNVEDTYVAQTYSVSKETSQNRTNLKDMRAFEVIEMGDGNYKTFFTQPCEEEVALDDSWLNIFTGTSTC